MLLEGRVGLIVGVANGRSLATAIAQSATAAGATVILTHQNERMRRSVESVARALGERCAAVLPCDVTDEAQMAAAMAAVQARFGRLDFLVHAVAAAQKEDLSGRLLSTGRDGFAQAMEVSVYSLLALCRHAEPLLRKGVQPSVLTLSYYAGQKAMPHYNIMGVAKAALESAVRYLACDLGPHGIRVNALSPGPVRTLSAAGIRGMRQMAAQVAVQAPLRRNTEHSEVGDAALFALSHLARGVTGDVLFVDGGFHATAAAWPQQEPQADPSPSGS